MLINGLLGTRSFQRVAIASIIACPISCQFPTGIDNLTEDAARGSEYSAPLALLETRNESSSRRPGHGHTRCEGYPTIAGEQKIAVAHTGGKDTLTKTGGENALDQA